jgi:hypothetical protein
MLKVSKPKHTIIAGMRSSGSTWLYNVVRLGFSQNFNAGYGVGINFPNHLKVIKKHDFNRSYIDSNRFVMMSVRDPRDMAASAIRRKIAAEVHSFLETEERNYNDWKPYIGMEVRYEDVVTQPILTIDKILKTIGSKCRAIDIEKKVSSLTLPKNHDLLTQLWHNHKTNGKLNSYMETLSGSTVCEIEKRHAKFIEDTGYDLHDHLFICCPNNSGSTILYMLLNSSYNSSCLENEHGIIEGHKVKSIEHYMPVPKNDEIGLFSKNHTKFSNHKNYNWESIIDSWYSLWDIKKPILVEKSPPNIYRINLLADNFNNAKFIVMVRNPYATCEGIMRNTRCSALEAAEHWTRTAQQQKINSFNKHTIIVKYEELTNQTSKTIDRLISFMPKLEKIDEAQYFNRPRYEHVFGLDNQNHNAISRINLHDIETITAILKKNQDLIDFWGYEII